MAISVLTGGGLPWILLKVGLEMGGVTPPCQGVPLVLTSSEGGIPLLSLQTTDKSFSQPRTTASSPTPALLPEASMATRRLP